jgi:alkanesulfonate monooxygenase SsuD/methylene tetrahydromethanopterin reductase-like flavin-dependent oxidoreductase (luciferase family)
MVEEFEALEVPFESRGRRMEEWVDLIRECWKGDPDEFDGNHYHLPTGVQCYPVPAHHIPFLVGGHSPVALRRAGALGDGWLAQQSAPAIDLSFLEAGIQAMRVAAKTVDRDPAQLRAVVRLVESARAPELVAESIPALADVGVTDVIVDVDWATDGGAERTAAALMGS